MSQREPTAAIGMSVEGMHYVLNALTEKGLVKSDNFKASEDQRRHACILTPKGLTEKATLARRFLNRKIQEYEGLRAEIDALSLEITEAESRVIFD